MLTEASQNLERRESTQSLHRILQNSHTALENLHKTFTESSQNHDRAFNRIFTEPSQNLHKAFTEYSQNQHSKHHRTFTNNYFTEPPQNLHRIFTEPSKESSQKSLLLLLWRGMGLECHDCFKHNSLQVAMQLTWQ